MSAPDPIATIVVNMRVPFESGASFRERWRVGFESFEEATGGSMNNWCDLAWDERLTWMPKK